jgi:2-iminobutanoate/2-iminopropanoate deaminase
LDKAEMRIEDIVNVTSTLTNSAHIPADAKVRAEIVGDARPAFMMQIVNQVIRPDILIEIVAAR